MRITAVEICHVAMPLLYPWRTAYGEDAAVESVLVRMSARDAETGRLPAATRPRAWPAAAALT